MLASGAVTARCQPCSSSGRVLSAPAAAPALRARPHCRLAPARAEGGERSSAEPASPSSSNSSAADEEARIEALEAAMRKGKAKGAVRRQIPIRNVTPRPADDASSGYAEWKEGALFPEGWDEMDLPTKLGELYLGRRGVLFWANKAAFASAIALLAAWVLFRIGGAVGLYQLQEPQLPPL